MDTTANRLNLAMEMRNMKAVDLSEKTGIGKSSISQYRNGIVNPKQDRIYLMAQALNVNEMWLMGHDVPMERQSPAPPAAQPPTAPYRAPLTERDERDIMISASSLSPVLNEEEREHLRKYRSIDDAGRKIVDGTLDTVYRMRQDDTKPQ